VATAYLLDTNILLRLTRRGDPSHAFIQRAVGGIIKEDAGLYFCPQNIVELWSVLTRPLDRNGFGLSPSETEEEIRLIERDFTLLPDSEKIHPIWRRLVNDHAVRGRQVHDARLVAAMLAYGVMHLLTLNRQDFVRYSEITPVHPAQLGT
jgi:predicted nucleic acid-binding protein